MRAMVAAAWVVMGCGGAKPPEKLEPPDPLIGTLAKPLPGSLLVNGIPRPAALNFSAFVPDPTEHGRWPLTMGEHPVLEPHFDIASALAQRGISWLELCERGAQNRNLGSKQDLTRYLAAWCDVAKHDPEAALYKLGTLKSSTVPAIAAAIKFDAANILVDRGDATEAEQLLRRSNLLEYPIADLLAASYFEAGHRSDAFAANRLAIALDHEANEHAICERLARGVIDAEPHLIDHLIAGVKTYATEARSLECGHLAAELACWRAPGYGCTDYFATQQWSLGQVYLFEAYERWPETAVPAENWIAVAEVAVEADPYDQALRFAVPAIEAGLRNSGCVAADVSRLADVANALMRRAKAVTSVKLELPNAVAKWANDLRYRTGPDQQSCLNTLARLPRFSERVQ